MNPAAQLTLSPESQLANLTVLSIADEANPDFNISDKAALEVFLEGQERHFWFTSRNAAIVQFLRFVGLAPPGRILEVGCGTGTVLARLIEQGYQADGVEMHYQLARQAAEHCPKSMLHCMDFLHDDNGVLDGRYDAVGLFDVLEHIAEPAPFLRRCAEVADTGGLVVGTVPALGALWSVVDELSGHYRRYDRGTMRRELEAGGLEVVRISYFFQTLVVPTWLHRKQIEAKHGATDVDRAKVTHENIRVPARPVNAAFRALCALERFAGRMIPIGGIPGASLFFAARKTI